MKTSSSNVVSLEKEKLLLSDFIDNIFAFVAELQQKSKDTGDLNSYRNNNSVIQNQDITLMHNQQNYLSLINPEIIIISEQYNQLNSIKSFYEDIINKVPCNLKQSTEFIEKGKFMRANLQESEDYFKLFEDLYNEHMHICKLFVDFDVLERKVSIYHILASIIEKSENELADIPVTAFIEYKEKILNGKISLKKLQKDDFYKKMRLYIQYFNENKDVLKEKILNVYIAENKNNNTEQKQKKIDKLQNMHKYYASRINDLYDNEYATIPQIEIVQTNLRNIEELVKDFKNYFESVN